MILTILTILTIINSNYNTKYYRDSQTVGIRFEHSEPDGGTASADINDSMNVKFLAQISSQHNKAY